MILAMVRLNKFGQLLNANEIVNNLIWFNEKLPVIGKRIPANKAEWPLKSVVLYGLQIWWYIMFEIDSVWRFYKLSTTFRFFSLIANASFAN